MDMSVSSAYGLPNDRLLLNYSSFIFPSRFVMYEKQPLKHFTLNEIDLSQYGVRKDQISQFSCQGADGDEVQTWVVRPSSFQPGKRYLLCMFIHGGPPQATTNRWERQINGVFCFLQSKDTLSCCPMLAVGYAGCIFHASLTTSGSLGVSEDFKRKVFGRLASVSYEDLEAAMRFVRENLDYVDIDRATAMGGSFGGAMTYWVADQPFANQFKALISHAGIFSAPALVGGDVPDAWRLLFGGFKSGAQVFMQVFHDSDPARYSHLWKTPMFISGGEKDRRVPCTHGLGAFSVLQFRGVESRLLVFPNEGHFVLKPGNCLR